MPRLLAIRIKLEVSITLYDLFCFQWTASGQTGPGEAAQESVAMGLRVELGTFHSLQCMEAPIAQGNQLAHRAVIHKSANLVKVSFHIHLKDFTHLKSLLTGQYLMFFKYNTQMPVFTDVESDVNPLPVCLAKTRDNYYYSQFLPGGYRGRIESPPFISMPGWTLDA